MAFIGVSPLRTVELAGYSCQDGGPMSGMIFVMTNASAPRGSRPRPAGRPPTRPPHSPAISPARRKVLRPPLAPVLLLVFVLCFTGLTLVMARRDTSSMHLAAALLGMFGSVLVFGWFRLVFNTRSSGGNFSDWGVVGASTSAVIILILSWVLGTANLYLVVFEWARHLSQGGV